MYVHRPQRSPTQAIRLPIGFEVDPPAQVLGLTIVGIGETVVVSVPRRAQARL